MSFDQFNPEPDNPSPEVLEEALKESQEVDPAAETKVLPQDPYLPGMEPQDSLDGEGGADA